MLILYIYLIVLKKQVKLTTKQMTEEMKGYKEVHQYRH